jgi:hypothetical protein
MKIFVSYPTARSGYAQQLTQALAAQRHEVVSDRLVQAAPGPLQEAVRDAIAAADLFIFVLAPEALAPGSHTRLELRQAQRRWPEPAGHVLTVPAAPTPWQAIPRYLRECARVRAPGARSGSPDAKACAAAVAELERSKSAPRRSGLRDSGHGGGREANVNEADTVSDSGTKPKPPRLPKKAGKPGTLSLFSSFVGRFQRTGRKATLAHDTLALAPVTSLQATQPAVMPATPIPPARPATATTTASAATTAAVLRTSPVGGVASPGRPITDWAGQRSWRRGKARGSSRRRSRRGGLWGLLRRSGGASLGVGFLALLMMMALAWMWVRVAPEATRRPALAIEELAELAPADPVARLAHRALRQCLAGEFATASQQLAVMAAARGAPPYVQQAREDCAMSWLRGAEVRQGEASFTQLVAPLRPLLTRALAAAPDSARAADLRAHLGWADFLAWLDSRSPSLDPTAAYSAALVQDRGNAYAEAMTAVWTLAQGPSGGASGASAGSPLLASPAGATPPAPVVDGIPGSALAQATNPDQLQLARQVLQQLQAASTSARRRVGDREALAFVRRVQLSSLGPLPELVADNVRMLDEMRRGNEPREPQMLQVAWTYLYAPAYQEGTRQRLLAALSAEDQLRTFLWCFPKSEPAAQADSERSVWRLVHGMLLTHAGRGREARADLAALHAEVRMHQGGVELSRAVDRLLAQRQ